MDTAQASTSSQVLAEHSSLFNRTAVCYVTVTPMETRPSQTRQPKCAAARTARLATVS